MGVLAATRWRLLAAVAGPGRRAGRLVAFLWLAFAAADGLSAGWGPPQALNGNRQFGYYPQVAVEGETVHVVWKDCCSRIFYVRSEDCGATWTSPATLTRIQSGHGFALAAVDETVHLVFTDDSRNVLYRASRDRGRSWSRVAKLADHGGVREYTDVLVLSASGPAVIAAWRVERRDSTPEGETWTTWIEAATSADAGRGWTRERLSKQHFERSRTGADQSAVSMPVVAAMRQRPGLHVAWAVFREWHLRPRGVVVYRRGDLRRGWEAPVKLVRARGKPFFDLEPLALAARRGKVHLLLLGRTSAGLDFDQLHMASRDRGATFSPPRRLALNPYFGYGSEANRLMAFDGRSVYVLGYGNVVSRSRDGGASWSDRALGPYVNSAITAARAGNGQCRRSVHLTQHDWPATLYHRRFDRSR